MYIYVCVSGMCHLTQRHAPNRPKLKMREKVACRQRTRPFYCENCGATLQLYVYIYIHVPFPSISAQCIGLSRTNNIVYIYTCVYVLKYIMYSIRYVQVLKNIFIYCIYIYLYTYAGNLYIMFYPDVPCYICTTPISTGAGDNPCIFSFFVN